MRNERQQGFALIAALLAILIILAVGILVFTITTQDIRTSTRIVGEKKAFSAAEAGIQRALQDFTPGASSGWVYYDTETDPGARYSYSITATPPYRYSPPGYDIEKWSRSVYNGTVTGENTTYGSSVQIETGLSQFQSGTGSKTTD